MYILPVGIHHCIFMCNTSSTRKHLLYISLNGGGDVEGTFQQITLPQEDIWIVYHSVYLSPTSCTAGWPFPPRTLTYV